MTITEFLTARLDEDEAVARTAAWMDSPYLNTEPCSEWSYAGDGHEVEPGVTHDYEGLSPAVDVEVGPHIARHDPARVLADVAAKRAIVGLHDQALADEVEHGDASGLGADLMHQDVIRLLALPYAGHEDYDEGWRP